MLADLALVEACEQGIAFTENLSLWLNLDDAIALRASVATGQANLLTQQALADQQRQQAWQNALTSVTAIPVTNMPGRIRPIVDIAIDRLVARYRSAT